MSKNHIIDEDKPRIKQILSSQLTGPIAIGANPYGATAYYTYSEIIVCDWLSRAGQWNRQPLVITKSHFTSSLQTRPCSHKFPLHSIKHIHVLAWPCSITDYMTEDGGWAVDDWSAKVVSKEEINIDCIQVTLMLAVRGAGARLNRVAYSWTAYVDEALEQK